MIKRLHLYWNMGTMPGSIPVLMVDQLGFNIGFYMLFPYLAGYLRTELGFGAGMVGLVLGLRNFSQQGLFIVGGTLSDRIGYKPVITLGCFIRVLGFLAFGLAHSLTGIIIASVLSGFAAAFFSPALQAYIAHEGAEKRVEIFAFFNVLAEVGLFIGPLLGMILLNWNFQWICFMSASLFFVLGILQIWFLPPLAGRGANSRDHFLNDWRNVIQNHNFIWFAVGMMGYYVLAMQIYLCIPLELQRCSGSNENAGYLFLLSALTAGLLQMRVHKLCKRWFKPGNAVVTGLMIMSASFLIMFFGDGLPEILLPFNGEGDSEQVGNTLGLKAGTLVAKSLVLLPALLTTALLTIGTLAALPYAMALIPLYGNERRLGTYYGFFYLAAGFGATIGNFFSGFIFDYAQETQISFLPWIFLALVGLTAALTIFILNKRGGIPVS